MDTPLEPAQPPPILALPPIRYLDMLPPELFQHIFDYLIPADLTVTSRLERRKALPSLCLVSKRFYQLARPALQASIIFRSRTDLKARTGKSHLWKHCRWLGLYVQSLDPRAKTNLEKIIRAATRLEVVACYGSASLVNIVLASHLTKLHLSSVVLPLDFVFASPTLEQLSLRGVEFPNQENLVHNLPSLRHLGYLIRSGVMDNNHRRFIDSLVPQLQSISRPLNDDIEWQSGHSQSGKLTILSRCTLLEAISYDRRRRAIIQNLQITGRRGFGEAGNHQEESDVNRLQHWKLILSSPGSSLTTLYLPSSISTSNPSLTDLTRSAVDELETLCRTRKVRIIHDDSASADEMDSLIPQELVRRVEGGLRGS